MERFGLTSPRDSSCFGITRSSTWLVLASSVVSPCGAYPWEGPGRNLLSGFCSRAGSPSHLSWRSFSCTARSRPRSWSQLITRSGRPCSHSRIECLHLGIGFYVTLLGISLYAGALWIARVCRVPLPVRFAEEPIRRGDPSQASEVGRKIFVMLIAATAIAILVQLAIFTSMVPTVAGTLPWYDDWPRHFAAFQWLPGLLDGLAVVAIALLVFRPDQTRLPARSPKFVVWPAVIAIAVPLAVALIPRLFLTGLSDFSTVLSNVPYDLLGFGAFPWVLIVFAIAALQELVLRVYLQNRFEEKFGFKRACLLVALLWWLLPLSIGFGPILGLRIGIPGVFVFVSLLVHILYNVPLAWLWSRTRSLWLVTIMQRTDKASDQCGDLIRRRVQREMTGIENVNFSLRHVPAIGFRLAKGRTRARTCPRSPAGAAASRASMPAISGRRPRLCDSRRRGRFECRPGRAG